MGSGVSERLAYCPAQAMTETLWERLHCSTEMSIKEASANSHSTREQHMHFTLCVLQLWSKRCGRACGIGQAGHAVHGGLRHLNAWQLEKAQHLQCLRGQSQQQASTRRCQQGQVLPPRAEH